MVTLAGGLGAHQDGQGAAWVKPQFGELVGSPAALLDIYSLTKAPPAAMRLRVVPAGRKAGNIGRGKGVIHVPGEHAAVINEAEWRRIRHSFGPNEIAPAE